MERSASDQPQSSPNASTPDSPPLDTAPPSARTPSSLPLGSLPLGSLPPSARTPSSLPPSSLPPSSPPATVCAIGNFDGVHRGHCTVLSRATREALDAGLRSVALTFDPPPAVVLGRAPVGLLTTTPRKVQLIGRLVPDLHVVVKTFDRRFADMTPADFARDVLVRELGAVRVVVGQNFRFGRGRAGDLESMVELGRTFGFVAEAAEIVGDEKGPWSSSRVRASIAANDWDDVAHVLGRPHAITGVVGRGYARGRTIGFPTANLTDVQEMLPPHGVFAVLVDRIDDFGTATALARGIANIGVRPTLDAGPSIEAHLFDFAGDLYGTTLRLHLVARIRAEQKFGSLDALKAQISRDQEHARNLLASIPTPVGGQTGWF